MGTFFLRHSVVTVVSSHVTTPPLIGLTLWTGSVVEGRDSRGNAASR